MGLFSRHKTKWVQLGSYQYGYHDYVVFVRGHKKTGMMEFKVKSVQRWMFSCANILPKNLIDVQKQWDEITNLIKS